MEGATRPRHQLLPDTLSRLITSFHILHAKGILTEYGHISVRNPLDHNTFFSSSTPANLIEDAKDLLQYNVSDGSPVANPAGGAGSLERISPYSEHYIHSSMFAMYPDVMSVVHSHSQTIIACGASPRAKSKLLKPMSNLTGFLGHLGDEIPIFYSHHYYQNLEPQIRDSIKWNCLINNKRIGDTLASCFDGPRRRFPIVLQYGHGSVTWGSTIEDAVYRAVYAQVNAEIALKANLVADDADGLCIDEAVGSADTINFGMPKAWPSWAAEVHRSPQYINRMLRD